MTRSIFLEDNDEAQPTLGGDGLSPGTSSRWTVRDREPCPASKAQAAQGTRREHGAYPVSDAPSGDAKNIARPPKGPDSHPASVRPSNRTPNERLATAAAPVSWNTRQEGLRHIGNSTHWIVLEGVSVLTDPWLSEPADHCLYHRVAPIPFSTAPDVVLLTHAHEDHFDPVALARLDRATTVVVPMGPMAKTVRQLGFKDVWPVAPGETLRQVKGLHIQVVKGKHSVPLVVYRVERNGRAFFFGADTQLCPEIEALALKSPVDFAVLPAEHSTLLGRRFVMTPTEAVALAQRLKVRRAVLSHHELQVKPSFPWRFLVKIRPVTRAELPSWFVMPAPGDWVPFPWSDSSVAARAS